MEFTTLKVRLNIKSLQINYVFLDLLLLVLLLKGWLWSQVSKYSASFCLHHCFMKENSGQRPLLLLFFQTFKDINYMAQNHL